MILRIDRLQMELPIPNNPSPNDAAAVQEFLGGKFGEVQLMPAIPGILLPVVNQLCQWIRWVISGPEKMYLAVAT